MGCRCSLLSPKPENEKGAAVRLPVDRAPHRDLPPHAHLRALAWGALSHATAAQAVRDHAGHLPCAARADQFPVLSMGFAGAKVAGPAEVCQGRWGACFAGKGYVAAATRPTAWLRSSSVTGRRGARTSARTGRPRSARM